MPAKKMYVYCETHEDWHIVEAQGLKEDCVIIAGHTMGAGMHRVLCPKCGSKNVHRSTLHECPLGGEPYRCTECYHTFCV